MTTMCRTPRARRQPPREPSPGSVGNVTPASVKDLLLRVPDSAASDHAAEAGDLLDLMPEIRAGLARFAELSRVKWAHNGKWGTAVLRWGRGKSALQLPVLDFGDELSFASDF